jgi:hypothetical protein
MTSISAVNPTLQTALLPVSTTPPVQSDAGAFATTGTPTPASVVILGENTSIGYAETYTSRGAVTGSESKVVQESEGYNKVTYAMLGNLDSSSTNTRFRGVGAALMQQLAEGKSTSFSQSLLKASASNSPSAITSAQSDLHNKSANTFSLTLKMASGATVTLSLAGGSRGLAVSADVSGGKLSSEELNALGDLADSFQGAIDGLSAVPPSLKLGDLAKLDPNMFSSVDLSSSLKLDEDTTQTFSFHADSVSKSLSLVGPNGNIALTVDTKNAAILGNKEQQAKALTAYLDQFDEARKRGEGDDNLMSLFKTAFTDLNGFNSPVAAAGGATQRLNAMTLNDVDHGMLTGLADFTASIGQPQSRPNPMHLDEIDKFTYNVSQSSVTKGTSQQNRSLEQNQQSSLSAAFHKNLYPGSTLELTSEKKSQNYYYTEIEDKASTTTKLAYEKGSLVEASLSQSATQTTRTRKYVMGELESDIYTPKEVTKSKNMLGMIEAALQRDRDSRQMSGKSTLLDDMKELHSKILLQPNPSLIRD